MSAFHYIKQVFFYGSRLVMDGAIKWLFGGKKQQTLLLVRVDAIGDFIVWLDSARCIREAYPQWKIVLVANELVKELADELPYFDKVIGLNPARYENHLGYRFKMGITIRQVNATLAMQPTNSRVFLKGDAMIRVSGASDRLGFEGDFSNISAWQQRVAKSWYSRLIPSNKEIVSEFQRNHDFLTGLGIPDRPMAVASIPRVADLTDEFRPRQSYYVLFPGAGSPNRMWPVKSFAELCRSINDEYGLTCLICGGPTEYGIAQEIRAQSKTETVHNIAGKTSLLELIEVIRGAELLVANETSAIHIAAAVNCSSVCLLGGGHFSRFMPYPELIGGLKPLPVYTQMDCFGCNWQCTKPHNKGEAVPCVTAIDTDCVMEAVRKGLEQSSRLSKQI